MGIEDLKTVRLLLLQLITDTERTLRYLNDMSPEREVMVSVYTRIQKAVVLIERQIKLFEEPLSE